MTWQPPRSLVSADRWDIAVKWRFFAALMSGGDADAERVYRWHIERRTGGVERRSWKRTVDDYVTACRRLLDSMRHGFDDRYPVILGNNGRMMEGAHRTACVLALRLDGIAVRQRVDRPGGAAPWGRHWFARAGATAADMERIEADWARLTL